MTRAERGALKAGLQAYYTACMDWLADHGYRWDIVDPTGRGEAACWADVDFLAVCYDDDMLPGFAAASLARSWRSSIRAVG